MGHNSSKGGKKSGKEWALIVATGPSLLRADIESLRPFMSYIMVVNCAVFYAPYADAIYAADKKWWQEYGPKVAWFKGERYAMNCKLHQTKTYRPRGWARNGGNSGHQALQLCIDKGHKNIALLGYDQQHTGGLAHCHKDHPKGMGNAAHVTHWAKNMEKTSNEVLARGVNVVNLSRHTALRCFKRMTVEEWHGKELHNRNN